ncbi:hypothetical protein LOTGIDRAFT_115412 [Lottia gigantea]|uniref:Palmitoyltransferase n=1 Tax=Lottia gigantea TaxID=225164 RepID=V3ZZ98_LOTGI|nr:hypothetical protein LOTGIDRAFT_115412 [Lottia gigantea]ESO96848.1 hypothetical protein LOTGIDRAFT_115412 [Lottia gigantea]
MAKITWTVNLVPRKIKQYFRQKWEYWVLMYRTMFYNEFTTWNSCIDTAMEPMFWFVDHFAKYLGPIMVTFVVIMITFVVAVFYTCLFPRIYFTSHTLVTVAHFIFGNWLLINIVFHYLMGVFRNAGQPPSSNVENSVSICKKCISPKPPRTHHCSVCNSCILKMDHHCPWLNNCVGFYNHHHFYLFCLYMWIGTIYVSYVGYDLFIQHFYGNSVNSHIQENIVNYKDEMFHNLVVFEFLLCTGVSIALGLLTLWHSRLISRGETSIEQHINGKERKRLKKKGRVFKNPYNLGIIANWKEFFGVTRKKSFLRLVLFPSFHVPKGHGLNWKTSTYQLKDQNGLQLL